MSIYGEIYNEEDLYRLSGAKNYNKEDYIRIRNTTNEIRYHNNTLQQKIEIMHNWKDYSNILGWSEDHYWVWVDVPKQ